jgi:hydroxyacylglutathione hydrolase
MLISSARGALTVIVPLVTSDLDNRTYLVADDASRRAFIIDPSFSTAVIQRAAKDHRLKPVAIILTHGHFDHIAGIPALRPLPIWIHAGDAAMLRDPMLNGSWLFGAQWSPLEPERLLSDGETLKLDDLALRVIHTPGHSPGGITFAVNGDEALITGDLLFRGGVGRTDLLGGDMATLLASIGRLMREFDDPPVHPGHGDSTTLDIERRTNPFLQV